MVWRQEEAVAGSHLHTVAVITQSQKLSESLLESFPRRADANSCKLMPMVLEWHVKRSHSKHPTPAAVV